mgnify:CR=1 FL=1
MKIIVLVKQTPDTTQLSGSMDGLALLAEDAPRVVNPWDEYALETALQLKETHGGTVIALCAGPAGAVEALRTAVAMGADEAVLLSDAALAQADTLGTARALAAAVGKLGGADLIVAGRTGIDGSSGATAVQVAGLLDIPAVCYVAALKEIDLAGKSLTATRLLDSGRQVVQTHLPALITVVKEINEPRYPSFMGLRKAKKADIPTWALADIGLSAGQVAAQVAWQVSSPPARATQLELFANAAQLADRLVAEQLV